MVQFQVFRIIEIFHVKQFFHFGNACFRRSHGFLLFINGVIFILFQFRHQFGHDIVIIRRLLSRAGNNQRCAGFIDENGVHFIDEAVVQRSLHHLIQGCDHIVTEVVEAEFIIRSVGNIGIIGNLSLIEIKVMDNEAYRETQEFINLAHPFTVSFGQVIIDRNDMNPFSFQRIQIHRSRCHQGFTFAGAHFCNIAAMEDDAADELYIKMTHAQYTAGCFADYRKSFGQDIIQRFPFSQPRLEFIGLIGQR